MLDEIDALEYPKGNIRFLNIAIMVISVVAVFAMKVFSDFDILSLLKLISYVIVYIVVLNLLLDLIYFKFLRSRTSVLIFLAAYLICVICMVVSTKQSIYLLYLLGPVMVSCFVNISLGIIMQVSSALILSYIQGVTLEVLVYNLAIGIILCVLVQFMKSLEKAFYIMIITISTQITLLSILKNFTYSQAVLKDMLFSVCSSIIVITIAYICFNKWSQKNSLLNRGIENTPLQNEQKNSTLDEIQISVSPLVKEQDIMNQILDEKYTLIQSIRSYSVSLFHHSIKVGELSHSAAKYINADANLAKAGGIYHEIGQVFKEQGDTSKIFSSLEELLPKSVVDLVRQHNAKEEPPKSIEAAIVMLTDSIVSTFDYLLQMENKKSVTPKELIEQIFKIRLSKGVLNESGLSIAEYNKLKEFYIDKFQKESL